MSIALSRLNLRVPEQVLHLVQRSSAVDQDRGKGVSQASSLPCRVPRAVDGHKRGNRTPQENALLLRIEGRPLAAGRKPLRD